MKTRVSRYSLIAIRETILIVYLGSRPKMAVSSPLFLDPALLAGPVEKG